MTIYERIKMLRVAKGMSQYDLAKKVGYEGRSAISKVENGDRDISQSMISKYADALGVSPAFLLYGEEQTPTNEAKGGREYEIAESFQQLTEEEKQIIQLLRALPEGKAEQVLDFLKFLANS